MQATDAFWHLANFFAPALMLGAMASTTARLLWRREFAAGRGLRLWAGSSCAAALASVTGLLVFGHDGKMLTYAAMVLAFATVLGWARIRDDRQ